jgi:hypothetical protein
MIEQPTDPAASGRNKAIGAWKGIASCFDCHEAAKHEMRHTVIQPIATDKCLRCHAMH